MGYGYSSQGSYFKTQNLTPRVAAIYRANQARNAYQPPAPKAEPVEEEFFDWWNYDNINGEWFPQRGIIQTLHPEVKDFISSKGSLALNIRSKIVINLTCPYGHKWKQVAKDFIIQHRTALTEKKMTCDQCEAETVEAKIKAEALALAERKVIAKANRIARSSITDNAERYFYIHKIDNANGETIAYKYGIATNIYSRLMKQQGSAQAGLKLTTVHSVKSTSKEVCLIEKRVKNYLKSKYILPAMSKSQLADGWTETVSADKITLELLLEVTAEQ